MTADRVVLERLIHEQMRAWARSDPEGYASTAGSDLAFTNIMGQRFVGRQAFVDIHRRRFETMFAGSTLEAQTERLQFLGPDVAVVELLLRLKGMRAAPPGIRTDADGTLRTRLLEVFERRDGEWILVVCHNVAVASTEA
jgi:uncharacterized protein (TIGR02246 family)